MHDRLDINNSPHRGIVDSVGRVLAYRERSLHVIAMYFVIETDLKPIHLGKGKKTRTHAGPEIRETILFLSLTLLI
jgi:hypothetical protein